MDKPKVIIDTNIFYHFNGYKKNKKITDSDKNIILKNYQLSITSASLYEMISRVQSDSNISTMDEISRQLCYLRDNNIGIISSHYFPLKQIDIDNLINMSYNETHVNEFINTKHASESGLTVAILLSIVMSYMEILSMIVYDSNESVKQHESHSTLLEKMLMDNLGLFETVFKNTLQIGQKNSNTDRMFEQDFNLLLTSCLSIWFITFYIAGYTFNDKSSINDFYEKDIILGYINNDTKENRLWYKIQKEKNINKIFKSKEYDQVKEEFLITFEERIRLEHHMPKEAIKFLKLRFETFIKKGTKVNKNDINDLVIFNTICADNYLLLSLDKQFIKLIKDVNIDSYNLNMRFKFI